MLKESEKAEIAKHILERIDNVDEEREPRPHRATDGFFPNSFYRLLKNHYPLANQDWKALSHPENKEGARQVIYLRENEDVAIHDDCKGLLQDLFEIVDKRLSEALLRKFGLKAYKDETDAEIQIIRDSTVQDLPALRHFSAQAAQASNTTDLPSDE